MRATVRRAVSPDRIESLDVRATDPSHQGSPLGLCRVEAPHELSATDAHAQWSGFSQEQPVKDLALEGWIWGHKLEFPLQIEPGFQRRMSRLATAQFEVVETLPHGEQPCTPVSANAPDALAEQFLARHLEFRVPGDGVIPATGEGGLPRNECMLRVIHKGSGAPAPPATPFFVTGASGVASVHDALVSCGLVEASSGDLRGTVETIDREIVDVSIAGGPEEPRRCFEEALWNVSLPADFNKQWWQKRQSYSFRLSPAH